MCVSVICAVAAIIVVSMVVVQSALVHYGESSRSSFVDWNRCLLVDVPDSLFLVPGTFWASCFAWEVLRTNRRSEW